MRKAILLTVFTCLSGCSTLPDVVYSYNKATWASTITVTQTLACNFDKSKIIVLSQSSVITAYAADKEETKLEFNIRDIDKWYSDVDTGITLTDDGRLKGINQTSNGQGEAIVKSAVTVLAAAAAGLTGPYRVRATTPTPVANIGTICSEIEKWGAQKPISLIFRKTLTNEDVNETQGLDATTLSVAPESKALYDLINTPRPQVAANTVVKDVPPGKDTGKNLGDGFVHIPLQETGAFEITISDGVNTDKIGSANVRVPLPSFYTLPIPKGKFFGKQTFTLALSESGSVTALTFGKTSSGSAALNSLGAIATTQTAATEAAELKAEADVIAQQQRLALCLSKPDQCK
ncbi:hypothetical protein [Cellvibrio sp. UBA7671]|uniref:hypothetical protein n=1 Tax=Cellvibrio sp. UBA7671 TaxID=1946312 RepID=UPI002F351CA0